MVPRGTTAFPVSPSAMSTRALGQTNFHLRTPLQTIWWLTRRRLRRLSGAEFEVLKVDRKVGQRGFRVETSTGAIEADKVVAATGAFQRPNVPAMVPAETGVLQMHSTAYRNPAQLPHGAVLIVGSAPPEPRSPKSFSKRDGRSSCRWGRTSVRRARTVGATTAGGWAFLGSGMRLPGRSERSA